MGNMRGAFGAAKFENTEVGGIGSFAGAKFVLIMGNDAEPLGFGRKNSGVRRKSGLTPAPL